MQKDLIGKIYLLIENIIIVPFVIIGSLYNVYPLKLKEIILLVLIYELLLIFYRIFLSKYIKLKINFKKDIKKYFLIALVVLSILLKGIIER